MEQNQVSKDRCNWLCEPHDECLVDCCHWPIHREVVLPEKSSSSATQARQPNVFPLPLPFTVAGCLIFSIVVVLLLL